MKNNQKSDVTGAGGNGSGDRNDVLKSCTELSDGKRCELLVAHPEWSTAVIDAIVRKDVILGMTPEQVELSVGKPLERREQSSPALVLRLRV